MTFSTVDRVDEGEGLRERTRRAVRAELAEAAQELFLANGYEATTVDQIAEAAGISKRSFFRYFASKEDVVIGKYELWDDSLVDALRARPKDEPAWTALRRTFDIAVDYYADEHRRARSAVMRQIVNGSPELQARYLQRIDSMSERLASVLHERDAALDLGIARAMAGAASACVNSAWRDALESADPLSFAVRLDEVMDAMRPASTAIAPSRRRASRSSPRR